MISTEGTWSVLDKGVKKFHDLQNTTDIVVLHTGQINQ